jgi:peptidoglycan-associated lipoprotein
MKKVSLSVFNASILRVLALLPALFVLGACTTTYRWEEVTGPAYSAPPAQDIVTTPSEPEPPPNIQGTAEDFVAYVGDDRVFFDFNQSVLKPETRAALDKQAEWLNRYPAVIVRIEGNTDERGTRKSNLALGERRANAVHAYLMSQGVAQSRLSTVSYGDQNPIEQPGSASRNRNVRTVVIATEAQ